MATASDPGGSVRPPAEPIAGAVTRSFQERARRVLTAARRVRNPRDAEAVHDLRVALRRLSEMLWLWRPVLRACGTGGLRRRLRRLRRRLGPVREAEVHLVLLRSLAPGAGAGHDALATLIERLERRRRVIRRAAARRAERLGIGRRLGRTAARIRRGVGPAAALAKVEERLERRRGRAVAALVAARDANDPAHIHTGRVALKRWRYAGESAAAVSVPRAEPLDLGELQEALGAVQDLAVLHQLLERSGSGRGEPLHEVRRGVARRLQRRRAAARRELGRWLEHRPGTLGAVALAPASGRGYRRTTRSGGGAPAAGRARAGRSRPAAG